MGTFSTNDRVSFDREGKTLTGKIVAYSDNFGGRVYVIQCSGEGPEGRFHVPENFVRQAEAAE